MTQIIEEKMNQVIVDTEINPMTVLQFNNKNFDAVYTVEGNCYFASDETISQEQYDTMKSAKTVAEWKTWANLSSSEQ